MSISDQAQKSRLLSSLDRVEDASQDYTASARAGAVHLLQRSTYDPLGTARDDDFDWLYTVRMVGHKTGRVYYQLLRDGNGGRCALCNVRDAGTLDHHLPKSTFKVFIVTPENLLPACDICNRAKPAASPPTLNPYFDDLGDTEWLRARIVERAGGIPEFFVDSDPAWPSSLAARVAAHFDLFKLEKVFVAQAVRTLSGMRGPLDELLDEGGKAAVSKHLQRSARGWSAVDPNTWQTAFFSAAADSDWFCSGGFKI